MDLSNIKKIIILERLHRYCFDKLYIQNYKFDENDEIVLGQYHDLYKQYPNFRQECAESIIFLSNIDRELTKEELKLLENLKRINFNRYSIDRNTKEILKKLK